DADSDQEHLPDAPNRQKPGPVAKGGGEGVLPDTNVTLRQSETGQTSKGDGQDRDHEFHDWLKSESERWGNVAREFQKVKADRLLTWLTGGTLLAVIVYTGLTYALQNSALNQVEAANTQNGSGAD